MLPKFGILLGISKFAISDLLPEGLKVHVC